MMEEANAGLDHDNAMLMTRFLDGLVKGRASRLCYVAYAEASGDIDVVPIRKEAVRAEAYPLVGIDPTLLLVRSDPLRPLI